VPLTPRSMSASQNPQNLLQLDPHLADYLLSLREIFARLFALQTVARSAYRKSLLVQEAAYLANHQHILSLVIAAIATALHRLELRKLLFPITKDMRFDATQLTHLTDGEVAFARNRRKFVVIAWFQHKLRRGP